MDDILSIVFYDLNVSDLLSVKLTQKYYNSYVCNKLSKKYIINYFQYYLVNNMINRSINKRVKIALFDFWLKKLR